MIRGRGQNQQCKRKRLTFKTKVEAIKAIDSGMPVRGVAGKYGILIGMISRLRKDRLEILKYVASGGDQSYKRTPRSRYPELDLQVYNFLAWMWRERIPVSGRLLKCFAIKSAIKRIMDRFTASSRWLANFLRRIKVQKSVKLFGEACSVCPAIHSADMEALRYTV